MFPRQSMLAGCCCAVCLLFWLSLVSHKYLRVSAVSCPTPSHPAFGRVMFNSVTYNSLISYECNYGYMIIGESVRRCDRSKEWTGLQPICRGILLINIRICVMFVSLFHRIVCILIHEPKSKLE